ncbi:MAG: hypothetical protein Q8L88_05285 [Bacteroidota bacterium]|nr:hypothetical protein [Bacteroidota bacterium]
MHFFKTTFLFCIVCFSFALSQESIQVQEEQKPVERFDHAITVGVLQGGGSLIGVDFEQLIGDKIGVQVGAGLIGFGAGVNYHFLPTSNSSAISIQFWNQGTSGDKLSQRVAGVTYLYRSETSGFTAQIGLGSVITRGKLMDDYYRDKGIANPPAVILLYSIGWYFK